jgi:hypothetical protein
VAFVYSGDRFLCTGALVEDNVVLTSGLCVSRAVENHAMVAYAATHVVLARGTGYPENLSTHENKFNHTINAILVHHSCCNRETLENDVALLRLDRPMSSNFKIGSYIHYYLQSVPVAASMPKHVTQEHHPCTSPGPRGCHTGGPRPVDYFKFTIWRAQLPQHGPFNGTFQSEITVDEVHSSEDPALYLQATFYGYDMRESYDWDAASKKSGYVLDDLYSYPYGVDRMEHRYTPRPPKCCGNPPKFPYEGRTMNMSKLQNCLYAQFDETVVANVNGLFQDVQTKDGRWYLVTERINLAGPNVYTKEDVTDISDDVNSKFLCTCGETAPWPQTGRKEWPERQAQYCLKYTSCVGDLGAPLYYENGSTEILVGFFSGYKAKPDDRTCNRNAPSVFTSVAHHIDWIDAGVKTLMTMDDNVFSSVCEAVYKQPYKSYLDRCLLHNGGSAWSTQDVESAFYHAMCGFRVLSVNATTPTPEEHGYTMRRLFAWALCACGNDVIEEIAMETVGRIFGMTRLLKRYPPHNYATCNIDPVLETTMLRGNLTSILPVCRLNTAKGTWADTTVYDTLIENIDTYFQTKASYCSISKLTLPTYYPPGM